jgi:5'-methylthioadenosine phosphorylase
MSPSSGLVGVLMENAARARTLLRHLVPRLAGRKKRCEEGCHTALDKALITEASQRDPALLERLDAIAGRALKAQTD